MSNFFNTVAREISHGNVYWHAINILFFEYFLHHNFVKVPKYTLELQLLEIRLIGA